MGAIINDKYILTAAHCFVTKYQASDIKAWPSRGQTCIDSIMASPPLKLTGNIKRELGHDLALVELEEPLSFDENFSPVCLNHDSVNEKYFAAGLGYDQIPQYNQDGKAIPQHGAQCLSAIPLRRIDGEKCTSVLDVLAPSGIVGSNQICAKGLKEGEFHKKTTSDLCTGDDGTPLMIKEDNGRISMVAVGSFTSCVSNHHPSTFEPLKDKEQWLVHNASDNGATWCQGSPLVDYARKW